jgi:hypothetical protein
MNIHSLDPKGALIDGAYAEYERGIDFFYLQQLVPLNLNIYYVEQLIQFPFGLFTTLPDDTTFFRVVVRNLIDAGLLIITRTATDARKGYTLLRFRNRVREFVKPEYRELFDERMRHARFDTETKAMFTKAKLLRDKRIAHLSEAYYSDAKTIDPVNLSDLKKLRDALNSLLDALSLNVDRRMLPLQYSSHVIHPVGADHTSDIERILDCVANNSALLNMAEEQPEYWSHYNQRLSAKQLELLNTYRKKFGLPEVNRL